MTRLIDADALKEQFKDRSLEDFTYLHFIDAIDNAPTVEERPKGKWIRITKETASIQMWNCSECGRTVEKATVFDPDIFFPYCHCGADMRGGYS